MQAWAEYLRLRGSLNVGLRVEQGFALLAMMLSRAFGGKADMEDFMPHFDKPEPDINEVMKILSGVR